MYPYVAHIAPHITPYMGSVFPKKDAVPRAFKMPDFKESDINVIHGNEFRRTSKNEYFQIIDKGYPEQHLKPFKQYLTSVQYVPADAKFIETLRTNYDPKTQSIAKLIIYNHTDLFVHDNYVYPISDPDFIVINGVSEENVEVFIQALPEFVALPEKGPLPAKGVGPE